MFTKATIRSFGHFEKRGLLRSSYHYVEFTHCEQHIGRKFSTKQGIIVVVVITKENCLRVFSARLGVISARKRNLP